MVPDRIIDDFEPTGRLRAKYGFWGIKLEREYEVYQKGMNPYSRREDKPYRKTWRPVSLKDCLILYMQDAQIQPPGFVI